MAHTGPFHPPDTELGVPDLNGMVWKQLKTKNGRDYHVGWRYSDAEAARALMAEDGRPSPVLQNTDDDDHDVTGAARAANAREKVDCTKKGFVCVNWPVGDDKWIDASQAVKDIGCSRYKLYFNGHPNNYDYTLEFTNTTGWDFCFVDEDDPNDCYHVGTFWNCDHWVKYNSKKPTILAVRQSACPSTADMKKMKFIRFG
ncbi:hypothetical protein F5144DRAFT_559679 [Chaetomium tenue]|uniref:Uncharacterized protein n=1 Tax=Chaetomium tenue TaxID=1854479 RepID=A0ACB7PEL2_9PEZI|nr:hypothetical protein F5144DRAFT_559679 [Chaetomium globosum]